MKEAKRNHSRFDEFTVLEVFLAVVLFGVLAGALFNSVFSGSRQQPVATAPTAAEYRTAASQALLPFFAMAAAHDGASVDPAATEGALSIVNEAHAALLGMTVPAEEREAHLSAVLLLDRWKRALTAGNADVADLSAQAAALTERHPWLIGTPLPADADLEL